MSSNCICAISTAVRVIEIVPVTYNSDLWDSCRVAQLFFNLLIRVPCLLRRSGEPGLQFSEHASSHLQIISHVTVLIRFVWTRLVVNFMWCLCLYSVISIMEYYWWGNPSVGLHSRSTSEGPTRWTSRWRWAARGPVWWRWWACPGHGPPGGTAGILARCSTPPWSQLCWPGFRPTRKSEMSTKESNNQLKKQEFLLGFLLQPDVGCTNTQSTLLIYALEQIKLFFLVWWCVLC